MQNSQQYNIFHVYMSDTAGRRHPGARAVEPAVDSPQAIRGNLYAVVEVFGPEGEVSNAETGRIAERLLGLIQSTHYSAKGSLSQVLTAAMQNAHQLLRDSNSDRPADKALRASAICVSFLNGRLVLASNGPALSLLVTEQAVEQFPSQVEPESAQLGGEAAPSLRIIQRDVRNAGAFYVGSSRLLNHIPIRTLLGSLTRTDVDNIHDVATYLGQESGYAPIPGMLFTIEPEGDDASTSNAGAADSIADRLATASPKTESAQRPTSDSLALQSAAEESPSSGSEPARRASHGSLPTSVYASPPVHTTPPADDLSEADAARWASPSPRPSAHPQSRAYPDDSSLDGSSLDEADRATAPFSVDPTGSHERGLEAAERPGVDRGDVDEWDTVESRVYEDGHAELGRAPSTFTPASSDNLETGEYAASASIPTERMGDRMRQHLHRAREAVSETFSNVLPGGPTTQAESGTGVTPTKSHGTGRLISPVAPQSARDASNRFETVASAAGIGADRIAQASATMTKAAVAGAAETAQQYRTPSPASGSRARMFASIAILITLLVPVIVAAVVWQRGASSRAEGEQRYEEARARYLGASGALDAGDKTAARSELTEAQNSLQIAQMLLGSQPRIAALQQEIENGLQEVLQIWPLYKLVAPLVRFPADAQPRRVMVVDQDIYILDSGRDLIQRFRLDSERTSVEDEAGAIVLRRGDIIAGQSVTDLVDMAWQAPIPGIEDKANLLVLDSSNHVFRYNQRVEGAVILPFLGQQNWQSPSQIEVYLGRVYVADGVSGQIFRYNPIEPGNYMQEPDPWLLTSVPTGLAGVQSMSIDGDIWLLFSDSKLLRYNQGQQAPFALDNAVGLVTNPVDLFVGVQENSGIYVADAGEERILVYDKEGSYKRQLQAAEGNPLRDLTGVFVDDVTQTIYILTQSALYQHPLPN